MKGFATTGIIGLVGAGFLGIILFIGFFQKKEPLTSGKVIPAIQLNGWVSDDHYAEVNPAALNELYEEFRKELTARGIVKWDSRYDCDRFAAHYISRAQSLYAVREWHSGSKAKSLALAEVWYEVPGKQNHAVVQIKTPVGDVFIEPQTGKTIKPIPERLVKFRKW